MQVAARDAEDNINDDDVENVDKVLLVSGIFREKCCLGATLSWSYMWDVVIAPHILQAINKVFEFTKDVKREDFKKDSILYFAIVKNI